MLHNTFTLVVCGGKSSRMGTDKSMLIYYKKSQRYHLYDMLQPFCEKVFISCNDDQLTTIPEGYSALTDLPEYNNTGPVAALLSAFDLYPGKNILLIGCDYPFLSAAVISSFISFCESKSNAISFCNKDDYYEPLLAWYPLELASTLKNMFEEKQYSLQYLLRSCNAIKYYPENPESMVSIDTHEQYINTLNEIKNEKPG